MPATEAPAVPAAPPATAPTVAPYEPAPDVLTPGKTCPAQIEKIVRRI